MQIPSKCLRTCKCELEEDERIPEDLFRSVLNPHLSTNSLVLCCSWSGHKDEQVILEAFGGKDVDLKIIPPKTTKYAQSLDVYFFRQYKIYAKRITDFIKLHSSNIQPKLHDRFLSWNCILTFTINYLRKHINQCFVTHGRTLAMILVNLSITSRYNWRGVQNWYYRMCSYDIHIALSILLKVLTCIYS